MSFERWGYQFDGAYNFSWILNAKAGVYIIRCKKENGRKILDVGESANVRERIENHEKKECWEQNCRGTILYSATYLSDENERKKLEVKIRTTEILICDETSKTTKGRKRKGFDQMTDDRTIDRLTGKDERDDIFSHGNKR